MANPAPPGRGSPYPTDLVAHALELFYGGGSFWTIGPSLGSSWQSGPDATTVFRWVMKYTGFAVSQFENVPVKVGATWVADSLDCMDDATQFLLASYELTSKSVRGTRILLGRATKRAGSLPEVVITDSLLGNLHHICGPAGIEVRQLRASGTSTAHEANQLDRLNLAVQRRSAIAHRVTARSPVRRILMTGWQVHHNLFRADEYLGGKTPAEVASAHSPFKNWEDVVRAYEAEERTRSVAQIPS